MKFTRFFFKAAIMPSLAAILLLGSVSQAATLLDDTWSDGSRLETNLPTESAFYFGNNDPAELSVTPGSLAYVVPTSSSKAHTYFTNPGESSTLGVGDTLSVSVTWVPRISMNFDGTSRNFRFGVFRDPTSPRVLEDSNDDGGGGNATTAPFDPWTDAEGYGVQIAMLSDPANTRAPFDLGKRTDLATANLLGSSGAYTKSSGGAAVAMSVNTEYTYTMDISKISATQTDVTMSLSDSSGVLSTYSVSDNGSDLGATAPYDDFDFIGFRWSDNQQTANTFQFREILVNGPTPISNPIVPEPSTALLALLSSASLGLVRRRK